MKAFTIHLFLIVSCCVSFTSINGKQWTEEDEKRRIAKIKEDELRQFKSEMGSGRSGYGSETFYGESEFPSPGMDYSAEAYPRYRSNQQQSYAPRSSPTRPPPPPPQIFSPQPAFIATSENSSTPVNWCFSCASSLRILSQPMQLAIQNLLDVRRAKFPKNAVVPDCHQPANIRTLPKQQCKHSYCQTLVLTEHERGVSFAIRGCAEHFAAIDEDMLAERGDNQCVKLHGSLDLRECVCKHRKYCYRGDTDDRIEAASEQIVKFSADAQSDAIMSTAFPGVLILSFCHIFYRFL